MSVADEMTTCPGATSDVTRTSSAHVFVVTTRENNTGDPDVIDGLSLLAGFILSADIMAV